MNHARFDFYLIALPDGKVLAMGGGDDLGPVYQPELFDPDNQSAG